MRKTKHWLMTIAVLFCSMSVSAHDFQVDGIYYNITSDCTVAVTFRGRFYDEYHTEYYGAVNIPSIVDYNGKTYSVTLIANQAFRDCLNTTSVTIPESVTSIGEEAFYNCSMTSIHFSEGVTNIGSSAFSHCTNLTSVIIPKSVKSIEGYAFYYCKNLISITILGSISSFGKEVFSGTAWYNNMNNGVIYIGKQLYKYKGTMPQNTSIEIQEGTTNICSAAFSGCSGLVSITLPESVSSIGEEVFYNCKNLTSINIPEGVVNIGNRAFLGTAWYNNLNDGVIYIGKSLYEYKGIMPQDTSIEIKKGIISICSKAFADCSGLVSITVPESVTSIGEEAFWNCKKLTSINIPKTVTAIGAGAFGYCVGLTSITCNAIVPPTLAWTSFSNVDKTIPVYVLASSVLAYQEAGYWNEFSNFKVLIPQNKSLTLNQYGNGTYCSEYALDFSEVEDLKAYAATGYNTATGTVTLTRVMTSKPGMGLFLKGEPGEYIVPVLENTDDNSLNMLVGTLEDTDVKVMSSDGLYYNYIYSIMDGDEVPKFYQVEEGYTLGAGQAYLQIPATWMTIETKSIAMRFYDGDDETDSEEDGATDIENETIDNNQQQTIIYNLMGHRVTHPLKGNVYIVNGKKVIWE